METASKRTDYVWNNATVSSSEDDDLALYLANIRHIAFKIIYIFIGTVGIVDNLFVIVVFALFIRIAGKVVTILNIVETFVAFNPVSDMT